MCVVKFKATGSSFILASLAGWQFAKSLFYKFAAGELCGIIY